MCVLLCGPAEVVLAWTDDREDPQWEFSQAALKVLEQERDAKGRKIKVHKLPIPKVPVCITEEELQDLPLRKGRICGKQESVLPQVM